MNREESKPVWVSIEVTETKQCFDCQYQADPQAVSYLGIKSGKIVRRKRGSKALTCPWCGGSMRKK